MSDKGFEELEPFILMDELPVAVCELLEVANGLQPPDGFTAVVSAGVVAALACAPLAGKIAQAWNLPWPGFEPSNH